MTKRESTGLNTAKTEALLAAGRDDCTYSTRELLMDAQQGIAALRQQRDSLAEGMRAIASAKTPNPLSDMARLILAEVERTK